MASGTPLPLRNSAPADPPEEVVMVYEGNDDHQVWVAYGGVQFLMIGQGDSEAAARADAKQQLAEWARQVETLEAPTP